MDINSLKSPMERINYNETDITWDVSIIDLNRYKSFACDSYSFGLAKL
jgi:hypothetical protein